MRYNTKFILSLLVLCVIACIFMFAPDEALARAGGAIGKKGGSWWTLIIFGPFMLISAALLSYHLSKKKAQSKAILSKIQQIDTVWNTDSIKARVEETFFKVQSAWMEKNQDIAKDYVTTRLYTKHKLQTDQLLKLGRTNIMENISLSSISIVEVTDFNDDAKDAFVVYIQGSMIDYVIDDVSHKVIEGVKESTDFSELWKFKRINNNWYLDEIDSDVSISDIKELASFTESNV